MKSLQVKIWNFVITRNIIERFKPFLTSLLKKRENNKKDSKNAKLGESKRTRERKEEED